MMLSPRINAAATMASTITHGGLTNSPIFERSLVNEISGITANDSCRLKTTCDNTSSASMLSDPRQAMNSTAGMIANPRLIRRRSHGWMRMRMKPSITIWPASVPVIVLACPDDSSATANKVAASEVPSSGVSNRCASSSFATSW